MVGLLSLIPRLDQACRRWLVSVCGCGWVEHIASGPDVKRLGTLLGPEETPGFGFLFWPSLACVV